MATTFRFVALWLSASLPRSSGPRTQSIAKPWRPGSPKYAMASLPPTLRAENDVFRKYGLGDYTTSKYTRVRGHGMGLFADSKPHLLETVATRITTGMALIVHPNTYYPDVGYLVLGDGVLVTVSGCEVLTGTPRELFSVPA